MTGTLINAAACVVGGLAGVLLKKGVSSKMMEMLFKVEGISIFVIGLSGVLTNLLSVGSDGRISSSGEMVLLLSLVIGTVLGEIIGIEKRFDSFGKAIEQKLGKEGFAKGFISASVIFCTGSMAIIGPINDGLTGDYSLLLIKSVLDGVTAMVLATTLGFGVCFSAVPVLVYQGAIALLSSTLSGAIESYPEMMSQFYMVGFAIIMCIGCNFVFESKIRTANIIPAMLVPIVYNLLKICIK